MQKKEWFYSELLKIITKSDNDDNESVNSDTIHKMTQQLRENDMVLREKDHEIEKLKAEFTKQPNSIQQTVEQTLAEQEKEFHDQIKLNL